MPTQAQGVIPGARPLSEGTVGEMFWSRPGVLKRELRLEAGSELLARLRWEKVWSSDAVAESADGRWIIGPARKGRWSGRLAVRNAATGAEVAAFTQSWRGAGTLRFETGAEFGWRREGFWRPFYYWTGPNQTRLIGYRIVFGWTRSFEMTVETSARSVAELPVLVSLGAYLMQERSAGHAQ